MEQAYTVAYMNDSSLVKAVFVRDIPPGTPELMVDGIESDCVC